RRVLFRSRPVCCLVGYLCFCLSQTSYYLLTSLGKGISFTFHLLARALTVERTVIGRPTSQCCQMYDNYPPNRIILSLWYDISNLATLSTLPPPLVALFTTAHDICMWKRCQNFVAGEGAGSSAYEKDVKTAGHPAP